MFCIRRIDLFFKVYTDWFKVAKKYDPNLKPPEEIPQSYRDMFTMNGHAIATKQYIKSILIF